MPVTSLDGGAGQAGGGDHPRAIPLQPEVSGKQRGRREYGDDDHSRGQETHARLRCEARTRSTSASTMSSAVVTTCQPHLSASSRPRAARRELRPRRGTGCGTPGRSCLRGAAHRSRHPRRTRCRGCGSSVSSGSSTRIMTTSWRWASRVSSRSQPGSPMKSEITKTRLRRRIVVAASRQHPRDVRGRTWPPRRRCPQHHVGDPEHVATAAAWRYDRARRVVVQDRADPVAAG